MVNRMRLSNRSTTVQDKIWTVMLFFYSSINKFYKKTHIIYKSLNTDAIKPHMDAIKVNKIYYKTESFIKL
jgi:hypothetical protein